MLNVFTYFPNKPRYWMWDSLYFVDTVLFSEDTGYLPPHFFDSVVRNVFIGGFVTLSAEDGHLQDFVTTEYCFVDNGGRTLTTYFFGRTSILDTTSWYVDAAKWLGFQIDAQGNFIGIPSLSSFFFNDSVRGMCYLMNNKRVCEIPRLPHNNGGNRLFLKFSPHFDSLLSYSYLFEPVSGSYGCGVNAMKVDSQGNIYVSFSLGVESQYLPLQLTFAENRNLHLDVTHNNEGFLVKLSPDFVPLWVKHLRSDYPHPTVPRAYLGGIALDEDSNAVFVTGRAKESSSQSTLPVNIDSTVIDVHNASLLFRFDMDDGHLVSYAQWDYNPTSGEENIEFGPSNNCPYMAASNGRVWVNMTFWKGFFIGDTSFFTPAANAQSDGEGILVLDYQGNLIDFMDFRRDVSVVHGSSRFLVQHDSVLLLGCYFGGGEYSWFGDSCVMANDDIGVIARYVDPAFARPYGQPVADIPAVPNPQTPHLWLYPNPATDKVRVVSKAEVAEVVVMDLYGRRVLEPGGTTEMDVSKLPTGAYIVRVRTRQGDTVDRVDYLKLVKK